MTHHPVTGTCDYL